MFRTHLTTALQYFDRGAVIRGCVHVDRALQVADEQQHEMHAAALVDIRGTLAAADAAAALRAVLAA